MSILYSVSYLLPLAIDVDDYKLLEDRDQIFVFVSNAQSVRKTNFEN